MVEHITWVCSYSHCEMKVKGNQSPHKRLKSVNCPLNSLQCHWNRDVLA